MIGVDSKLKINAWNAPILLERRKEKENKVVNMKRIDFEEYDPTIENLNSKKEVELSKNEEKIIESSKNENILFSSTPIKGRKLEKTDKRINRKRKEQLDKELESFNKLEREIDKSIKAISNNEIERDESIKEEEKREHALQFRSERIFRNYESSFEIDIKPEDLNKLSPEYYSKYCILKSYNIYNKYLDKYNTVEIDILNSMLNVLVNKNDIKQSEQLLEVYKSNSITPNSKTYELFVRLYINTYNIGKSVVIKEIMDDLKLPLSKDTYGFMVKRKS